MTRVVLVVGRANGGIGVHVRDLAQGLSAQGYDVDVVTHAVTARTFALDQAHLLWPDARRLDPRRLWRLRRVVRSADVVHAHGHQAAAVSACALAGSGRGSRPLVVSLHNDLPAGRGPAALLVRRLQRAVLRRAALVTGASSDLVAAAAALGARAPRFAAVPSPRVPGLLACGPVERTAARERVRTAYGLAGDRPLVVTVSRIAPQKDLPTLLDASAALSTPVSWLVAGGGVVDLLARLRERVRSDGLPVAFVGPVSDAGDLLLAADVFVISSRWEARALVVQEAMAAGTSVVAPAVGGLPDLLSGGGGVLVPPGDGLALAAALETLLRDEGLRAATGRRGRERAREWGGVGDATREWATAYQQLDRGIS